MKLLRFAVALSTLLLGATPTLAGGFSFDLPRLDFPAPRPETTRDCQMTTTTGSCTRPRG